MKQCGQCGADISHRAPQARFCEDPECHKARMLAHGRVSYQRHREDIRERQNAAHRARVAAKPKRQRSCAHCGKDISHRGGRARWCDMKCRDKARHRTDPGRARDKAAVWRAKNPERWRELWDGYKAANPGTAVSYRHRASASRRTTSCRSPAAGPIRRATSCRLAGHATRPRTTGSWPNGATGDGMPAAPRH